VRGDVVTDKQFGNHGECKIWQLFPTKGGEGGK